AGLVAADAPDFEAALEGLAEAGGTTRDALLEMERKQIGAINRELEELERAVRSGAVVNEIAASRRTELQQEFEEIKAAADEARAKAEGRALVARTIDGQEVRVTALNLVNAFPANRAGFFERIGEMVRRVN